MPTELVKKTIVEPPAPCWVCKNCNHPMPGDVAPIKCSKCGSIDFKRPIMIRGKKNHPWKKYLTMARPG